jgi:hypothetical protein
LLRASDEGGADGLDGMARTVPAADDSALEGYFLGDPRPPPAAASAFRRAAP